MTKKYIKKYIMDNPDGLVELKALAQRLADLHFGDDYGLKLEQAADKGEIVYKLKYESGIPHGKWMDWLKNWIKKNGYKISDRSIRDYLNVYEWKVTNRAKWQSTAKTYLSISAFLMANRHAKRAERHRELAKRRDAAIAEGKGLPPDQAYRLVCADNRKYKFPKDVPLIFADPPWAEMAAYEWLNGFALEHLKDGGLCLVQCGSRDLKQVLEVMNGLTYLWTLAIVYDMEHSKILPPYITNWRPLLLFGKANTDYLKKIQAFSDVWTVKSKPGTDTKPLHPWEQPLSPFQYWLNCLTQPNDLVLDPWAGAATIGVALKTIGNRQYLGTERNKEHFMVARGRLRKAVEFTYPPKDKA